MGPKMTDITLSEDGLCAHADGEDYAISKQCEDGFGAYHRKKIECVACPARAICFCQAWDTKVDVVTRSLAADRYGFRADYSSPSYDSLVKHVCPWRTNSSGFAAIRVILRCINFQIDRVDQLMWASIMKYNGADPQNPTAWEKWVMHNRRYIDPSRCKDAEKYELLRGLITENPTHVFRIDVPRARQRCAMAIKAAQDS